MFRPLSPSWLTCARRATAWLPLAVMLWAAWLLPGATAQAQRPQAPVCPPQATAPTTSDMVKARQMATDRGLLWRITRDGHSSWLYGTLHVGRAPWFAPGPTLRNALAASDLLALELDGSNPRIRELIADAARRPGPSVPEPLKRELAERLESACVPREAIAQIGSVMQAVMLGVVAARWEGLHGEFGSEAMLSQWAQAAGKKVVSLETVKRQFSALMPDSEALAAEMVRSTIEQHDRATMRPMLRRLASAWERGDVDEIAQYERWCQCVLSDADRQMMKRINDDRNPDMARGIDALHRGGKRVFAAVGALHMTGAQALPALMAQLGYSVERITMSRP